VPCAKGFVFLGIRHKESANIPAKHGNPSGSGCVIALEIDMSTVLANLQVVSIDSIIFGGETTLSVEDLGDAARDLPLDIIKLGTQEIVDKKFVREIKNKKNAIKRILMNCGTRYKDGYAVPVKVTLPSGTEIEVLKSAMAEIRPIENEISIMVAKFLTEYPRLVQEWAAKVEAKYPGWGVKILNSAPSVQRVEKRLYLNVDVEGVTLPVDIPGVGDGGLSRRLSSMPEGIINEISAEFRHWEGKEGSVNSAELRAKLKKLKSKAETLSFLDGSGKIIRIAQLINDILPNIPESGKLKGVQFLMAQGLIEKLKCPEDLMADELEIGGFDLCSEVQDKSEEIQEPKALEEVENNPTPIAVQTAVEVSEDDLGEFSF